MNILLIDPAGPQTNVTHNVGLAYLSGALQHRGHTVAVLDLNNYSYTDAEIIGFTQQFQPEWIGFSVKTALVASAEKTCHMLRTTYPHAKYVVGGPHLSITKDAYMKQQGVYDFGLIGEGEYSFADLVEGTPHPEISGLIYRERDRWKTNTTDYIQDLESLPYPTYLTWDRIDRSLFPYPMVHSRGCPYHCSYCSVPKINGRRFRKRSAESVINELRHARREYVFKNFEFIDDNFTLDVDHAKDVCEQLIQADLNIGWYANNGIRADRLDRELAQLMKRSGCLGVAVGIESADEKILKAVNKGETLDDLHRGIRLLKNAGIVVGGHFIVGLPGDTLEKVKKSIQFKDDVGLDYSYFNQLIPYPGTQVEEWVRKHATLLVEDVTNACHFGGDIKILMETPEFPKQERQHILERLSNDCDGKEISSHDFSTMFSDRSGLKVLLIRSGRMDPYHEIRELLPKESIMDVLATKGILSSHPDVDTIFEYPHSGLMLFHRCPSELKKVLKSAYDLVIYMNTMQSNMNFDNILTIGRNCGKRVFEYRPEQKLKEMKRKEIL